MSLAGAADLSREAIEARQKAGEKTSRHGGWSGRELIDVAASVFETAKRHAKLAQKRSRKARAEAAGRRADQALVTAATQIRVAELCPLDKPYLHALSLERIQSVRDSVTRDADNGLPELAVDTHRRIQAQRLRAKRGC